MSGTPKILRIPLGAIVIVISKSQAAALRMQGPAQPGESPAQLQTAMEDFKQFARSMEVWGHGCAVRYFEPAEHLVEPIGVQRFDAVRRVAHNVFDRPRERRWIEEHRYSHTPVELALRSPGERRSPLLPSVRIVERH